MLCSIRTYTLLAALALLGLFIGAANRVQAQTYQIDCAIRFSFLLPHYRKVRKEPNGMIWYI